MKNLKKLVIASFMLVIAFVAVVSSTYAWFTNSDEAKVNNITIGVVDADAALLISQTGNEGSWKSQLTLDEVAGKFTPITAVESADSEDGFVFKKLNNNFVYATEPGLQPVQIATTANSTGYFYFDLYFRVDAESDDKLNELEIKMTINSLHAYNYDEQGVAQSSSENAAAVSSFRLAVVQLADKAAGQHEPTALKTGFRQVRTMNYMLEGDGTGRYNSGDQFTTAANDYIVAYSEVADALVVETATPGTYTLKDTAKSSLYNNAIIWKQNNAEVSTAIIDCAELIDLDDANIREAGHGYYAIRIYVWMEGWDGDNMNAAAGCEYGFGLTFKVDPKN